MSTKTTNFIKRAKEVHGNFYDYSLVNYTIGTDKITIICSKHGSFIQEAKSHIRGYGCRKCGTEKMLEDIKNNKLKNFISNAREVHGNRYDYSNISYDKYSDHLNILCKEHGIFKQTKKTHLSGSGCPSCKLKNTGRNFIKRSSIIHNEMYDYNKVKYKKSNIKVNIICPIHGEFQQTPANHLQGQGCPECSLNSRVSKRCSNIKSFISKAKKVHDDKYDYSKTLYTKSNEKVTIICPEHGSFEKEANSFLSGFGCNKCTIKNSIGFYNKKNIKKADITGLLYFLKVIGHQDTFYKIGITKRTIEQRIKSSDYKNYKFEVIFTKTLNLYDAFILEQFIKKKYRKYRYIPIEKFPGSSECFSKQILSCL